MRSMDGLIKNLFLQLTKKYRDSRFPFIRQKFDPKLTDNLLKKKAILLANRCCKAIKINKVPIHLEFIKSKTGIIPIDFSIRGAGSQIYSKCISELIKSSSSKVQIDLQLQQNPKIVIKSKKIFYIYFLTSIKNTLMKTLI